MKYSANDWGRMMIFNPINDGKVNFSAGDEITLDVINSRYDLETLKSALTIFCDFEESGNELPSLVVTRIKDLNEEILPYLQDNDFSYYTYLVTPAKKLNKESFMYQELLKLENG